MTRINSIKWDFEAWQDYLYWQKNDRVIFEHRVVYLIEEDTIVIFQCKGHYK